MSRQSGPLTGRRTNRKKHPIALSRFRPSPAIPVSTCLFILPFQTVSGHLWHFYVVPQDFRPANGSRMKTAFAVGTARGALRKRTVLKKAGGKPRPGCRDTLGLFRRQGTRRSDEKGSAKEGSPDRKTGKQDSKPAPPKRTGKKSRGRFRAPPRQERTPAFRNQKRRRNRKKGLIPGPVLPRSRFAQAAACFPHASGREKASLPGVCRLSFQAGLRPFPMAENGPPASAPAVYSPISSIRLNIRSVCDMPGRSATGPDATGLLRKGCAVTAGLGAGTARFS
ncbi:hypothetical protein OFAG_02235 [Oxalobacter formigenes HOxBLS]|uniref:Uncharacterized protein n=1 Tax=Oxalobacter paraformigenes TaxID=556268 RepID=T5LQJ2_9BURK|nr:hypothetical protein OFAG_02235 [Oxalobacter paraformigenes]